MKHYGDVTQIKGNEVPIVDIITGGSPCQDLSVAGKRAGLAGERSGLFMEQIRIIKEMRDESRRRMEQFGRSNEYIRPRYMVWENVPGSYSSNKGEDFRAVLEETAKVADKDAVIPRPTDGKWSYSGCIVGDRWSIAWRTHDAQFWGVPQRRKRICLVADFNGDTAGKILFDVQLRGEAEYAEAFKTVTSVGKEPRSEVQPISESVSRDSEQSKSERQSTPADAERGIGTSSYTLKIRGGVEVDSYGKRAGKGPLVQTELSATLGVSQDQTLITGCLNPWDVQSKHVQTENGIAEALYSGECRGGGGESYVMTEGINGEVAGTLDASYYNGCGERQGIERDVVCYGISAYESNAMKSSNPYSGVYEADTTRTLDNNGGNPACNQGGMVVLEGNGSRDSHKGDGYAESETMYTLNTVEQHAVCCESYQKVTGTLSPGAHAGSYNGQDAYNDMLIVQNNLITYGVDEHNVSANEEKTQTLISGNNDNHNIPSVCYGLDRASFNQGQNAKFDFSVEEELAPPIVARGAGGGNADTIGALCARDYKGVGNQYVNEGKCIVQNI